MDVEIEVRFKSKNLVTALQARVWIGSLEQLPLQGCCCSGNKSVQRAEKRCLQPFHTENRTAEGQHTACFIWDHHLGMDFPYLWNGVGHFILPNRQSSTVNALGFAGYLNVSSRKGPQRIPSDILLALWGLFWTNDLGSYSCNRQNLLKNSMAVI